MGWGNFKGQCSWDQWSVPVNTHKPKRAAGLLEFGNKEAV